MFKDKRSKANQLLAWFVLVLCQAGVAALNWTWVMYDFAGQHKELMVSGYNTWPIASVQVLFGLVGFAVLAFTRGLPRKVMAFLIAALSIIMAITNLTDLPGAFANRVPAKVNGMVETASGIAGGGANGSSAAILYHTVAVTLPVAFTLAAVLLALLQLAIAFTVENWAATEKRDKYQKHTGQAPATDATPEKNSKNKAKKSKNSKPEKGDNITLWDSQR